MGNLTGVALVAAAIAMGLASGTLISPRRDGLVPRYRFRRSR